MKYFVIFLILIGATGTFLAVDPSYGLWMPSSPEELVQQSKTIFVGTVVEINLVDVDYFSQIARNGTLKESISPETMQLEEYTVHVEEFLKNPQETDTITVLRATVGGVPGGPAKISGFDVGERVLFYLPNDEKQTHFQGQYLPESFRIPEQCDAKMTLKSKRIEGENYFSRMQNGIEINDNFTANIPIQFRYDRDVGTLSGQSFEVNVGISKITDDVIKNVFQKTIQINAEPCEWIGSAKWDFVPQNGEYSMNIQVFEDTGRTSSNIRFSALDSLNEIMSPLKQTQSGIPFNEIQCKQTLVLIQKYDDSPACVTEPTKTKLVERGWTETKTPIEKLLAQNQINYDPNTLAVASGFTYGSGYPACGAVIDQNSETHWFEVDSRSNTKNMTIYSENPNPCKINWSTCFCYAQTKLTELTIDDLSYLSAEEEEQIGERVKEYFETIPHAIPVTKFVVGKYNLDLGEQYNEICGMLLTKSECGDRFNDEYSVYTYFSAAKEGIRLWDFSLSVDSEMLCAISDDAKIFEYEKQKQ